MGLRGVYNQKLRKICIFGTLPTLQACTNGGEIGVDESTFEMTFAFRQRTQETLSL